MHGNMSGPLIIEGKFTLDRMVGPPGDGRLVRIYLLALVIVVILSFLVQSEKLQSHYFFCQSLELI